MTDRGQMRSVVTLVTVMIMGILTVQVISAMMDVVPEPADRTGAPVVDPMPIFDFLPMMVVLLMGVMIVGYVIRIVNLEQPSSRSRASSKSSNSERTPIFKYPIGVTGVGYRRETKTVRLGDHECIVCGTGYGQAERRVWAKEFVFFGIPIYRFNGGVHYYCTDCADPFDLPPSREHEADLDGELQELSETAIPEADESAQKGRDLMNKGF